MSETPNEPQNADLPGFSTATDVGGTTGTQGDAVDENRPTDPATIQPDAPTATQHTNDDGEATETEKDPGKPVGNDAPSIESLQNKLCPNCHTGVLYVINYDPGALHEVDQGAALGAGKESGGGYEVQCGKCTFSESRAFNPGPRWGKG